MGELSVVRRGKTDADGILIPQSEFTLWLYGKKQDSYTYITEPVWESGYWFQMSGSPSSTIVYSNITWENGIITLSNPSTISSSSSGTGYHLYNSGIYYLCSFGTNTDGYYGWIHNQHLKNATAPYTTYYGHVYARDSNKYPTNGVASDGYYYIKKTSSYFRTDCW